MAKRGLSSKQWTKTLLGAALLVAVLLLVMLQLTDGGKSNEDNQTGDGVVIDPLPEDAVPEEEEPPVEEPPAEEPPAEEPPAEEQKTEETAQEPPAEPSPKGESPSEPDQQPQDATETPSEAAVELEAEPPARSSDAVGTMRAEPPAEAELRERMENRLAALTESVDAMTKRQEEAAAATARMATAKMAEAMLARLAAEERAVEAAEDLATAKTLDAPAEALTAKLVADEQQQAQAAELINKEFETLKTQAATPVEPPATYRGTSQIGEIAIEHRAQAAMPVAESQQLLNAVGEAEAIYIRSLRWNGQAKTARDLWIGMGATYALLPPPGSFDPIYRVGVPLGTDSALGKVDQDDFFARYSNRFTILTTGEDAEAIERVETRLIRTCGMCTDYRLALVWNWETLAVILSDAKALARQKGLRLPEDVKIIDWLAVPGSGAGRARVDVVKLIARDGTEYGP